MHMQFLGKIIKYGLLQMWDEGRWPQYLSDLDECDIISSLTSVSYTVSMVTVLHNKQSFNSEYEILLERPYDAHVHLNGLLVQQLELGMEVEQMGNYMFKSSTKRGYTLFTIAPTKPVVKNILTNTN